jgi:formylglycine-generating enzyme required for sulfatase activity
LPAYFSQQDILKFIEKLNEITGKQYRLPTENEWLYAAHGGKNSKNYKYSGSNKWKDVARFSENSREAIDREQNDIRKPDQIYHVFVYSYHYVSVLQPVDRYNDPNELGIYLMSGGVWELCTLNGENNKYILRGGGYTDYPLKIDEARKEVSENCGFRLVLDAE